MVIKHPDGLTQPVNPCECVNGEWPEIQQAASFWSTSYAAYKTQGHLYKSKLRRDTALLKKFYRLHIKHMLRAKITFAPCLA